MAQRGIKVRELAAALGTSEALVSRWRHGTTPGPHYRRKLIRKLQLTDEDLRTLGWEVESRV